MIIGTAGVELIESFESLRLRSYQDQRGIWTIGYGHTARVAPGMSITPETATIFLKSDLAEAVAAVNRLVKAALTQNQFDALASFCFNCGEGNFAGSTLLKLVNESRFEDAANAFSEWDHVNGVVSDGLLRRRDAERALFLDLR